MYREVQGKYAGEGRGRMLVTGERHGARKEKSARTRDRDGGRRR